MGSVFSLVARVVLCAALSALAAGTAQARPADPERLASINSIGIVAALGDTVSVRRIGTTKTDKLGTGESALPNSDWALNKRVIAQVTELLAHRYVIKPVVYDPAQLAGFRGREAAKTLAPIATKNPVNAFLVIVPREVSDADTPNDVSLPGLGLYRLYRVAKEPSTRVFAGYQMVLVDTEDFSVIARSRAILHGSYTGSPVRDTAQTLWAEAPAGLTKDQQLKVKDELIKLLDQSIPQTLAELELTP